MSLITIASKDRHFSSVSTADCKFMMTPGIEIPKGKGGTRLRLEYCQVYNTPFTIQTGINDTVDFNDTSTNRAAVLTPGYYNGTTLATELSLRMSAVSPNNIYTAVYVTQTRSFTITATSLTAPVNFTLNMLTGAHSAISPYRELGFLSSNGLNPVDTVAALACTAPFPINLALPLSWYVAIPELGMFGQTSSSQKFSLYLPMVNRSGQVMEYSAKKMPTQTLITSEQWLRNLSVVWSNSSGTTLSMQNFDWELVFSVIKD
jgi:hypothetical protein